MSETEAQASTSKVKLGDTEVTRIGLGTNRLRHNDQNADFVRDAVAAGIELIDTAHSYADGESETTIGAALESSSAAPIVATKGGWGDASAEALETQIEESLRRLRTDSIGLYYLHKPDPNVELEESLAVIERYREQGAIQRVGVSNVSVEQIERAREVSPVVAVQNHYNLDERGDEDVVDYCAENGIAFLPYFPLKADGGQPAARIAAAHDATAAQVVLAWLLRRSPAMRPIPGTLSIEHVRENLAALELELGDDELAELG